MVNNCGREDTCTNKFVFGVSDSVEIMVKNWL